MEEKLRAAQEVAKEKALQLSEELKTKVHPLIFFVEKDKEPVVGYVKEPNRSVKLAVMDKYAILLKEHSDPRISSERSEDDMYYMGAVYAVSEMIQFAGNQVDKKK
jgi:hypothetical protein